MNVFDVVMKLKDKRSNSKHLWMFYCQSLHVKRCLFNARTRTRAHTHTHTHKHTEKDNHLYPCPHSK